MGNKSAEQQREWRRRNPHKHVEYRRRQKAKILALPPEERLKFYRERSRLINLRRLGLTKADYEKILRTQRNRCAICRTDDPGRSDWRLDHCHETGKFRGLLCHHCNVALGLVRDSVVTLRAMIKYLKR